MNSRPRFPSASQSRRRVWWLIGAYVVLLALNLLDQAGVA